MADYLYDKDDGLIHTRYTELASCTPGSIAAVVARRLGQIPKVGTASMEWGTDRHDMFESESRETGLVPACFSELDGFGEMSVEFIEQEFSVELYPGVIIHLRPDAVSKTAETVLDYKTCTAPPGVDWSALGAGEWPADDKWKRVVSMYRNSRQLKFYAFMLGLNGIRIRRGVYLIEVWNNEHNAIIGYAKIEQEYPLSELAKLLPWARDRIALLKAAVLEAANAD